MPLASQLPATPKSQLTVVPKFENNIIYHNFRGNPRGFATSLVNGLSVGNSRNAVDGFGQSGALLISGAMALREKNASSKSKAQLESERKANKEVFVSGFSGDDKVQAGIVYDYAVLLDEAYDKRDLALDVLGGKFTSGSGIIGKLSTDFDAAYEELNDAQNDIAFIEEAMGDILESMGDDVEAGEGILTDSQTSASVDPSPEPELDPARKYEEEEQKGGGCNQSFQFASNKSICGGRAAAFRDGGRLGEGIGFYADSDAGKAMKALNSLLSP